MADTHIHLHIHAGADEATAPVPAGDVRLGFKWDNEADPAAAEYRMKVFARNFGPAHADVGEVWAESLASIDALLPDGTFAAEGLSPRSFHTVFAAGERRDVYALKLSVGDSPEIVAGFIRWRDANGKWEIPFAVQPRTKPGENEHHFTLVGALPWNETRRR